jgi:arylsulfatase A-like enzyme
VREKPDRPNILFITADQWRGDAWGGAGHPVVKTPHLDRLAARGTAFLRHYTQAAPCSPARAALYTGLYQMTNRVVRNGTPLDRRHDTLALALRRHGYDPTLFGYTDQAIDPRTTAGDDPWLRTYEGILPGFSVRVRVAEDNGPWISWLVGRGHPRPADPWDIFRPVGEDAGRITRAPARFGADETEAAFLTEEFIRWHGEQSARRPWCAHLSYLSPHPPYVVPEPYASMYADDAGPAFQRRPTARDERASHPFLNYQLGRQHRGEHFRIGAGDDLVCDWTDADFRLLRALYFGMISDVDTQLGRVFAHLEATGDADRTVIVFTSDHGELMGDHWSLGKYGWFDPCYHVPFVIADPRRPQGHGQSIKAFTEAIDVLPTLLDVAGAPPIGHLDGVSLLPFLEGHPPSAWRDSVHWEYDFREVATGEATQALGLPIDRCNLAVVRTDRFKYVHFAGLPPVLHDLADDPGETRNVVHDLAYTGARLEMAERLLSWRAAHLDRRLTGIELTEHGLVDARAAPVALTRS